MLMFKCEHCQVTFATKQTLDYHTRKRVCLRKGERRLHHVCQTCGKDMKSAHAMERHMKKCGKVVTHSCTECGKQFQYFSALVKHGEGGSGCRRYEKVKKRVQKAKRLEDETNSVQNRLKATERWTPLDIQKYSGGAEIVSIHFQDPLLLIHFIPKLDGAVHSVQCIPSFFDKAFPAPVLAAFLDTLPNLDCKSAEAIFDCIAFRHDQFMNPKITQFMQPK